ncbi:MAG TPA: acylphosphatase [Planctomycetota bacterium]|jgi:acylphosphatase|nr:acylphosphatase [Planctomycetota bacterium]
MTTPRGGRDAPAVRARVVITGRVQGVFYRASCRDEGAARGLSGWIRNTPDGAVEAAFEGPEAEVQALIEWCRRGPPSAWVEHVEVSWETPTGERGFRIIS